MNRRENLKSLGLLSAHAVFPTVLSSFLSSCLSKEKVAGYQPEYFSDAELKALSDLIDLIIPRTATPGASDAGVHIFIDKYVMNCFTPDQQGAFRNGLQDLNKAIALRGGEKLTALTEKENESHASTSTEAEFIKSLKNLTLLGYFFSKNGAAASGYLDVPGKFVGCIDLKPGQHAELLNSMT